MDALHSETQELCSLHIRWTIRIWCVTNLYLRLKRFRSGMMIVFTIWEGVVVDSPRIRWSHIMPRTIVLHISALLFLWMFLLCMRWIYVLMDLCCYYLSLFLCGTFYLYLNSCTHLSLILLSLFLALKVCSSRQSYEEDWLVVFFKLTIC